ncbi:MAG: hypothetical protein Q9226_007834, partial [Calogaya cf. arnoldii]
MGHHRQRNTATGTVPTTIVTTTIPVTVLHLQPEHFFTAPNEYETSLTNYVVDGASKGYYHDGRSVGGRDIILENVITNPLQGKLGTTGVHSGDLGPEIRVSAGIPQITTVKSSKSLQSIGNYGTGGSHQEE